MKLSRLSPLRPRLTYGLAAAVLTTVFGTALAGYEYRIPVQGLRAVQAPAPGDENGSPVQSGALLASTDTVSFGIVKTGTTSVAQSVVVTNTGAGDPLSLNLVVDDAGGKYLVSNGCTAPLAPAGSCQISVSFKPTSMAAASGSLTLTTSAQTPLTVVLQGEGGKSILGGQTQEGEPLTTLAFPDTRTNTTSENRSFALANTGNLPLTFQAQPLTTNAPFTLVSNTCAGVLAPAASCEVTARFAPTQTGLFSVPLSIASDAQEVSPLVFEGRGTAPLVHVTPATLDFGTLGLDQSKTMTATVSNTGPGAATLEFSDVDAPFALSHDCPVKLEAAASCTLTVTFSSASADAFAQTLTISGGTAVRNLGLQATAVDNSIQGTVQSVKDFSIIGRTRHFDYSPITDSFYLVDDNATALYEISRPNAASVSATQLLGSGFRASSGSMTANGSRAVLHTFSGGNISTFKFADKSQTDVPAAYSSSVHTVSRQGDRLYIFGGNGELSAYSVDANGLVVPASKQTAVASGSYRAATHDGTHLWYAYYSSGVNRLEKRDGQTLAVLATYTPYASSPAGVIVDMTAGPDGVLYIAGSSAVYRFDPNSESPAAVQLAGSSTTGRNDGAGLAATFVSIKGITWAVDRLYVWDATWLRSIR